MISLWKYHKTSILFVLLSALFYWAFAYQLERTDFPKLLGLYVGLFVFAFQLRKMISHNFKAMFIIGLGLRLIFILAIPNLSQDFYRFIWDGNLNLNDINPYLFTPNALMINGVPEIPLAQDLFNGMGELSASNYSNYPPFNQLCFVLATFIPGASILSSVIGLRLLIILADIGILFIGTQLLEKLQLPKANIFWYFLNPFIIIELTGNLHFEGVMLFFLVAALYLLVQKQLISSAICYGLSISVKLVPLMLLPLFFSYFLGGWNKSNTPNWSLKNIKQLILYCGMALLVFTGSFIHYTSGDFIDNYSATIGLWFNNFEFNASIYYLLRGLGYAITGYNEISIIGKILPLITIGFIGIRSVFSDHFKPGKLIISMLLVVSLYLFLSTTVHPWYIATLVALGIFTNYKYPIVWSLMVILSYYAYSQEGFKERYWLLAIEYGVVLWFSVKELTGHTFKKLF